MITKEAFCKFINTFIEYDTKLDKICKVLNVSLHDCELTEYPGILLDKFLQATFNQNGIDTIYWWLFEKRLNPELEFYIDDEEINVDTLDDLWEIVKDKRI